MKTEIKKKFKEKKEFDSVETFRAIKEKISKDIIDMDIEQIKTYLKAKKIRLQD